MPDWSSPSPQLVWVNIAGHPLETDLEAIQDWVEFYHPGATVVHHQERRHQPGVYDILVSVTPEERALHAMSKATIKKHLDATGNGFRYFGETRKDDVVRILMGEGYDHFRSTLMTQALSPNLNEGSMVMSITDTIKSAAQDHNLSFRPDYSGRGMYGARCIGVVGDDSDFLDFWADLDREVRDEIGHPTTDNMGLSTIWYWPGVEGYQDPEEDDDEDW